MTLLNILPSPIKMTAAFIVLGLLTLPALNAQDKPAATPDVLIFKNGDQLTGAYERSVGTDILFKSDAAGELTIPMEKIKELRTSGSYVVLKKDEKITSQPKPATTVAVTTTDVKETSGSEQAVPAANVGYVVDAATYTKELTGKPGIFSGWNGSITGGATILQATNYGQTYTLGVSLARTIPTVSYLPMRTRTIFNVLETYGKLTQPTVPQTTPATPDAVAKTSIFHTDFEHDKYLSSRFYLLGGLSFDHNFAQGMQLQQIYGGGAGYTILLDANQQLDAKADIHYEKQHYIQPTTTLDQNLIGSTFAENYRRTLPGKIALTESGTFVQSWNNTNAWSGIGAVGLALPVYHRLAVSVNLLDNYLNNPADGYNKNSLQFVTGVTYTLH